MHGDTQSAAHETEPIDHAMNHDLITTPLTLVVALNNPWLALAVVVGLRALSSRQAHYLGWYVCYRITQHRIEDAKRLARLRTDPPRGWSLIENSNTRKARPPRR